MNALEHLSEVVARLRDAKIHHQLRHTREDAVSVDVAVPGERWELDFLQDGTVEVEIFRSDGQIHEESKLTELFASFSD